MDDTFNPEAFDVARIYYLVSSKLNSNNSSVDDKTKTSFIDNNPEETSSQKDKNVTDNPPEDAGDWEGMFD